MLRSRAVDEGSEKWLTKRENVASDLELAVIGREDKKRWVDIRLGN